jgi:MerR family transcriptional regulator, light-induced transcriptional regulator
MTDDMWRSQVEEYLAALGGGDRAAALAQVRDLQDRGHDLLEIIHRLLAPAQLRVGELWMADDWSVAQEHAATAISEAVLTTVAVEQERRSRAPEDGSSVVVSCVEQEWHALPALMLTEHLRADGFAVSYLGANASAQGLVRHIHDIGPRAVLLSCSLPGLLPLARRQVEAVRESGTPVVVGGSGFDAEGRRAKVLGATAFARSARGVGDLLRALPSAVPPAAPLTHPGAEEAYVVFSDRESLADDVERLTLQALAIASPRVTHAQGWVRVLDDQLPHLVGSVAGALISDDASIVTEAIAWAEVVLRHRGAPERTGQALRAALREALQGLPVATRLVPAVEPV